MRGKLTAPAAVRLKDGTIVRDRERCDARWQEHFCEVLAGRQVKDIQLLKTVSKRPSGTESIDFGPERVYRKLMQLPLGKGVGCDGIPADLLRLAPWNIALHVSTLCRRLHDQEQWPVAWKGGRMVSCYKGKFDHMVCDNSRGLLLGDHMAKIPTGILKDELDTEYRRQMPSSHERRRRAVRRCCQRFIFRRARAGCWALCFHGVSCRTR